MNNSELTDKARGVARTLTYNDDAPQAQAKHNCGRAHQALLTPISNERALPPAREPERTTPKS